MSGTHAGSVASPFRQPKAVFAVAFACVVSFMGIGLVDPILPAISHELHASPSEVTLSWPRSTAHRSPRWSPRARPSWPQASTAWCTWCTRRKKPPPVTWRSTARAWTRPGRYVLIVNPDAPGTLGPETLVVRSADAELLRG